MMLLLSASVALAATITVAPDGSGDHTSISAAAAVATDGDTIEIAAGTYYECVETDRDLVLSGAGSADTVLDAAGYCDVALAMVGNEVTLQGLTVANDGEVAITADVEALVLEDVVVGPAGASDTDGPAGLQFDGNSLDLSSTRFESLQAISCAALDIPAGAVVTMEDGSFDAGRAHLGVGGAVCVQSSVAEPTSVSLSGVAFSNIASEYGGALWIGPGSTVSGTEVTWDDTESGSYGEGIAAYVGEEATLDLTDCRITASSATGSTAVIIDVLADDATLRLTGCEVDYLTGGRGGIDGGDGSTIQLVETALKSLNRAVTTYGPLETEDCDFDGNTTAIVTYGLWSDRGSAVHSGYAATQVFGEVDLDGTSFSDQEDQILIVRSDDVVMRSVEISNVRPELYEPATIEASSSVEIEGLVYRDNAEGRSSTCGGALTIDAPTVSVSDSVFSGNTGDVGGGLCLTTVGVNATVVDSEFHGNEPGGLYVPDAGTVEVVGSLFTGQGRYPAAWVDEGTVSFENSWFLDNDSHGILVQSVDELHVAGVYSCGNGDSGLEASSASVIDISESVFSRNTSARSAGGLLLQVLEEATLSHVSLLGNEGLTGGGMYANVVSGASMTLTNSIVAGTAAGDGLYGYTDDTDAGTRVTYTAFHDNLDDHLGGSFDFPTTGFGNVEADPELVSFPADGDCWTDSFALSEDSPLRDAGTGLDADGSVADMGATGGEGGWWRDDDEDGWVDGIDCDDDDDSVYPGATEVPDDGIDQDCDGDDLAGGGTDSGGGSDDGGPDSGGGDEGGADDGGSDDGGSDSGGGDDGGSDDGGSDSGGGDDGGSDDGGSDDGGSDSGGGDEGGSDDGGSDDGGSDDGGSDSGGGDDGGSDDGGSDGSEGSHDDEVDGGKSGCSALGTSASAFLALWGVAMVRRR